MSTDPTALAREVLDADKVRDSTPGTLYLDGPTHEHEEAASAILDAAPTLARAVIAVAELADRLDVVANELEADGEDGYADAARTDAHSIRAALNGVNA